MINGTKKTIKARYDSCDIFCGERYVRLTSTSTADPNLHTVHNSHTLCHVPRNYHIFNGPETETSRAKVAQKSRLSRCPSTHRHPRDPPADPPTQWKQDANIREIKIIRRYHLQNREDYHKSVTPPLQIDPAHLYQIQQTLRRTPLLCSPSLHPPPTRSLPRTDGGPAPLQALRHRRPHITGQTQRRRQQTHRRRLLSSSSRRVHVHDQNGRVSQRSTCPLISLSATHPHRPRPQSSSNRAMSASVPIRSQTPPFSSQGTSFLLRFNQALNLSPGIWRTLSLG